MTPAVFDFKLCVAGDKISSKTVTVTFRDDLGALTEPDIGAYTAEMSFEGKHKKGTLVLTSGTGDITLVDNVVTILEFTAPAVQDVYQYNLKLFRPDGAKLTYLRGDLPVQVEV